MKLRYYLVFCLPWLIPAVFAADTNPELTPRMELFAEFQQKPRCPVYEPGEPVSLWVALDGTRKQPDHLIWTVTDYWDRVVDGGSCEVPKGDTRWTTALNLNSYGAGYFEVHLSMQRAGTTIPRFGTRPPGIVAYGVLSAISALPLKHVDDSRFGAQGTNFVESSPFGKRDELNPVYPVIGMKWVYSNRRIGEVFASGENAFKTRDDAQLAKYPSFAAKNNCALLVDLHSIPAWLMAVPEGKSAGGGALTHVGQAFPPNDYEKFKNCIRLIVDEQVRIRNVQFPNQAKNYYQLHWEPDWHWRGTDEEFIKMHQAAYEVIHERDPRGLLLGPNYGVLRTGNAHLKRLLPKGLGKYLDGILTHTYYITAESKKSLPADVAELVSMTRQYLPAGAKIMNTEWGLEWKLPPDKDPNALRWEVASFMRGHLITLGEGVDSTFYFYTADGGSLGGGLFYNLTFPHPTYGATHLAPKPVAMAAATATRLLEGTKSLGALRYVDSGVLGYAFERNGEGVICMWSEDGKDRKVSLPVGNSKTVLYVDPMGNTAEAVPNQDGVVEIPLTAMPSWVKGIPLNTFPFASGGRKQGLPGERVAAFGKTNGAVRVFDQGKWVSAGSRGWVEIPKSRSEGPMLTGLFDAKSGELHSTVLVDVRPVLALAMSKRVDPGFLNLTLTNTQSDKVAGELELIVEGKVTAGQKISVDAGKSLEVAFGVRGLPSVENSSVRFKDLNGALCRIDLTPFKRLVPATRAVQPPVIDGKLDDWALELFHDGKDPKREAISTSFGTKIAARYDDKNLYLAVKFHDAQHRQIQSPSSLWRSDSVQFGLAVHPKDGAWEKWQKIGVARNSVNNALMAFRDSGDAFPIGALSSKEIRWNIAYVSGDAFYEVEIPWEQVCPGLSGPPEEKVIGFGIMVNDVNLSPDGKETPRKNLDGLGGMHWSNPAEFGLLELK